MNNITHEDSIKLAILAAEEMSSVAKTCVLVYWNGRIKININEVTESNLEGCNKIQFKFSKRKIVTYLIDKQKWKIPENKSKQSFFERLVESHPEYIFHLDIIQKLKTATGT